MSESAMWRFRYFIALEQRTEFNRMQPFLSVFKRYSVRNTVGSFPEIVGNRRLVFVNIVNHFEIPRSQSKFSVFIPSSVGL